MKKRGRKSLKISEGNKVLGKCYICKKEITKTMLCLGKAVYLGKGIYRCRSKKCEKKIVDTYLKKLKTRKTWAINPVTKVIPNKKKKTRAQTKREFKRRLKEE